MEQIKLHINRLGIIRNADIIITPMMVFSGESGLGKSYLAILCHYFFYVLLNDKRFDSFFKEILETRGINFNNISGSIPDNGIALTITKDELHNWLAKDAISYLSYMLGHEGMTADITVTLPDVIPEKISFAYEKELTGIENSEELYYKLKVLNISYRFKEIGIQEEIPYAFTFRYGVINELFGNFRNLDYNYVLPPSRGSYLSEEITPKTGLYRSFVLGMKELEQVQELPNVVNENLVALLKNVMEGEVKKSGDNYVYITHGETIPASAAASSVREIGPLQMMVTKRDISKVSVLIEEPEAHLHPLKQRMMADIIATMASGGANMQITTHSDSFLFRLNDFIRMNILKKHMDAEAYLNFCEEHDFIPELTLDPSILSTYFLERDENGYVTVKLQNSTNGIPFDTFEKINGKPMADSSMLYDLTADL